MIPLVLVLILNYVTGALPVGFLQHASWVHLLMNCAVLIGFGFIIERRRGLLAVLAVFLGGAWLGGIVQYALTGLHSMGASAGALALVAAYAWWWPNKRVLMLPARLFVFGYAVAEMLQIIFQLIPHVAHVAHLTGIAIGVLYAEVFDVRDDA